MEKAESFDLIVYQNVAGDGAYLRDGSFDKVERLHRRVAAWKHEGTFFQSEHTFSA